jgi:hypothetical protein
MRPAMRPAIGTAGTNTVSSAGNPDATNTRGIS